MVVLLLFIVGATTALWECHDLPLDECSLHPGCEQSTVCGASESLSLTLPPSLATIWFCMRVPSPYQNIAYQKSCTDGESAARKCLNGRATLAVTVRMSDLVVFLLELYRMSAEAWLTSIARPTLIANSLRNVMTHVWLLTQKMDANRAQMVRTVSCGTFV